MALPLSDPTDIDVDIYILLGPDFDLVFVSMIVSILFLPRNLASHTESNVVLDWSSFVGDGLWVVPCCIFYFLSYGFLNVSLWISRSNGCLYTIDGDVVIRSRAFPRTMSSQCSLAQDRLVHRAGWELGSSALAFTKEWWHSTYIFPSTYSHLSASAMILPLKLAVA